MSERPADYQITVKYKCEGCGNTIELRKTEIIPDFCVPCGGQYMVVEEGYPANREKWEE